MSLRNATKVHSKKCIEISQTIQKDLEELLTTFYLDKAKSVLKESQLKTLGKSLGVFLKNILANLKTELNPFWWQTEEELEMLLKDHTKNLGKRNEIVSIALGKVADFFVDNGIHNFKYQEDSFAILSSNVNGFLKINKKEITYFIYWDDIISKNINKVFLEYDQAISLAQNEHRRKNETEKCSRKTTAVDIFEKQFFEALTDESEP